MPGRRLSLSVAAFAALVPAIASGARVYIFRGGDPAADNAVRQTLQERGHSPNLGIETIDFDGTQVKLADFDVVVVFGNAGFIYRMAAGGKTAIRDYLLGVGRLVTAENFIADLTGDATLGPVLPATSCGGGAKATSITYSQVAPIDPIIHSGLPASFTFPLDSNAGTCLEPVSGARAFYSADTLQNGSLVSSVDSGRRRPNHQSRDTGQRVRAAERRL